MRISDWSSDVCSSDLQGGVGFAYENLNTAFGTRDDISANFGSFKIAPGFGWKDRKSVVKGKSVSVRVDLGGRCIIKKKKYKGRTIDNHKHELICPTNVTPTT